MEPPRCASPRAMDDLGEGFNPTNKPKLLAEINLYTNKTITPAIHNKEFPCTNGDPTTCPYYPQPSGNKQRNKINKKEEKAA